MLMRAIGMKSMGCAIKMLLAYITFAIFFSIVVNFKMLKKDRYFLGLT